MVALVRIAALVILILCVPLNVLPVETAVYHHRHHHPHPVSFVLLAVAESIAVLMIPILCVSAVIPVTTITVVPEKNATKSANLLAVVVVVERVGKEERVDTTVVVVDTKFVNLSVNWSTRESKTISFINENENLADWSSLYSIFHSCGTYNVVYIISPLFFERMRYHSTDQSQTNTNDFLRTYFAITSIVSIFYSEYFYQYITYYTIHCICRREVVGVDVWFGL